MDSSQSSLIQALMQVLAFSIVPFAWWFMTARTRVSFFQWIGLKRPVIQNKKQYILALVAVTALFLLASRLLPSEIDSDATTTAHLSNVP